MIRYALYGLVVGLCIGGLFSWASYNRGQRDSEAAHVLDTQAQQAKNIETQKSLIKGVEKVAADAQKEQLELEARASTADAAVDRLRETVRSLASADHSSTTAGADAARARTLLAQCAARYRDVARRADQLRSNVLGLQAYVREVTK